MEIGSSPLSVRRSVLVAGIIGLIGPTPVPGQSVCEVDHVFASDGGGFHNFGRAVAVSGDTSLIGAETAGGETGYAYVFRFDGTRWVETQKLLASDGDTGEFFGRSVALRRRHARNYLPRSGSCRRRPPRLCRSSETLRRRRR